MPGNNTTINAPNDSGGTNVNDTSGGFVPATYTITFNANDGSGNPATKTQAFTEGTAQNLKKIAELGFKKDGYGFAGWGTEADATQSSYADGSSYTASSNATLYALWSQLPVYSVISPAVSGGIVTATPATGFEGVEITLTSSANPGWGLTSCVVTDSDSNPVTVTDGKFIMPAGDVTVTAVFSFTGIATLATLPQVIAEMPQSETIVMTGEVVSDDLPTINNAIKNSRYPVNLDLTRVVGLTSLRSSAFYNCSKLQSVFLPNTISAIPYQAFYKCTGLQSVTISGSVNKIGNYSFYDCVALSTVVISDGVKIIDGYAFAGCYNLTNITIPNSVETIGYRAFWKCAMSSFRIPDSLKSFGGGVGCSALEATSKLENIEVDPNHVYFSSKDGILFDKAEKTLIQYPSAKSGSAYDVPAGISTIGSGAFYGCKNLTEITIPNTVTSIKSTAFYGCVKLKSVNIPNSVTQLEGGTFACCSELTSLTIPSSIKKLYSGDFTSCRKLAAINVDSGSAYFSSVDGILFNKDKTMIILVPEGKGGVANFTSYSIPQSVTCIGDGAFRNCYYLQNIVIPNSVKTIESLVFYDCCRLATVTIPNSVTAIGADAFEYCSGLVSLVFNNPNNWYRVYNTYDWDNKRNGTPVDLTDSSKNAANITYSYVDYSWYRL